MEKDEWLTAEKAMTYLGMDQVNFLSLLLKKSLLAYRFGNDTPVDVERLLRDRRVKGRRPNLEFAHLLGLRGGLSSFELLYGPMPAVNLQMISDVLSDLFFKKADIVAYERGLSAPVLPTPEPDNQYDEMTTNDGEVLRDQRETPVEQARYSFVNKGPTWAISFDGGKPIEGLRGKGFSVIHYFVNHPKKRFSASALQSIFDPGPGEAAPELWDGPPKDEDDNGHQGDIGSGVILDSKALREIRARREELLEELREAEEDHDLGRQKKINVELEKLKTFALDKTWRGRSARFRDDGTTIEDRYVRQIKRALNALKKHDETAWRHFRDALRPVKNFCYNPAHEIDWML
jgi:hypothetical protein